MKIVSVPVKHISSTKCRLWYPVARSISKERKNEHEVLCAECVSLQMQLQIASKRLANVPSEVKIQHQQAQSNFPMSYLSPNSLHKRK